MGSKEVSTIGKTPVVVLSLTLWREIEEQLEDLRMMHSESFRKKITKARSEKKEHSRAEVKRALGI